MTHFFNEFHDFETDAQNRQANGWTGGSGVLPRSPDLLPYCNLVAWATFALTFGLTATLQNASASLLGLVAILLSWQYSAPPFNLNGGMGIGEAIVAVTIAGISPLFGYVLAAAPGSSVVPIMAALSPVMLMAFFRQLMMNLPDMEADRNVEKLNICVRIGSKAARRVFAFGTIASYGTLWACVWANLLPTGVAALQSITLPMTIALSKVALRNNKYSDTWLAQANLPFLASMNLTMFACLGLAGFSFLAPGAMSYTNYFFLGPTGLYVWGTLDSVKRIMKTMKTNQKISFLGWRP